MSAIISPCGTYRYRLDRIDRQSDSAVAFIMVNPSTADATADDATIRKVKGFSERLGHGRIIVGNLFAFRATDIKALRTAKDPVGPDNDTHLEQIMLQADLLIVAWGALAKLPTSLQKRWIDVVRMADRLACKLHCIGINDDGHPRHPVMTGYDIPMTEWSVPWFPNRTLSSPSPADQP